MSLTRKKITVRTKRGKTFQRSVLVKEVVKPKRYLSPSRFYAKHGDQFKASFALGVAQGAAAYGAAKLGARRGRLAGAAAGLAAYKGTEHVGLKLWDRTKLGERYKRFEPDLARVEPERAEKIVRAFHVAGYAGNVVGAAGAWATHRLMNRSRR